MHKNLYFINWFNLFKIPFFKQNIFLAESNDNTYSIYRKFGKDTQKTL